MANPRELAAVTSSKKKSDRNDAEKLAARGGANANKSAIVAVARKLSVILHKLWRTGEDYIPFPV